MAWNLEIHTIDVAQGESSLLVAYTDDGTQFKSMLIDGGLGKYGRLVNNYVATRIGDNPVDVMITTHYDIDHSGGHISIFLADNLSVVATLVGKAVGNAMDEEDMKPSSLISIAIAGIAAYSAVIAGAYNDGSKDNSDQIDTTIADTLSAYNGLTNKPKNTNDAMEWGLKEAFKFLALLPAGKLNKSLMRTKANGQTKKSALATVNAALNLVGAGNRIDGAVKAFFEDAAPPSTQSNFVQLGESKSFNFFTAERYRDTQVYNPGRLTDFPVKDLAPYFTALEGSIGCGANTLLAPDLGRKEFLVPALGQELWGTPQGAPRVFCVAVGGKVLGSNMTVGGDPSNSVSIGVVVEFGDFYFYTGGDLPKQGLDMIPAAINNLKKGKKIVVPVFKAGHHGSEESNTQAYIDATLPIASMISVGSKKFKTTILPSDAVTKMLTLSSSIQRFYLTNCKVEAFGVPASKGKDQLVPGNKSRVAGDNEFDPGEEVAADVKNPGPKINRGDIILSITAAQASSKISPPTTLAVGEAYRQFLVTYWEKDDNPIPGKKTPIGTVTETLNF